MEEKWSDSLLASVDPRTGDWKDSLPPRPEIKPPKRVRAAHRLRADIDAMLAMTSSDSPPLRSVRQNKMLHLIYGFTDASGKGEGSSLHDLRDSRGQKYRIGVWTAEESKESANWREFTTLVQTDGGRGGGRWSVNPTHV